MGKLKNLYQKAIRSPKYLTLIFFFILSATLIIYTAIKTQPVVIPPSTSSVIPTAAPALTPTAIIGQIVRQEPFPTPTLNIRWTTKTVDIPTSMDIFFINQPLINPKNTFTVFQKLGFSSSDEQPSIDENFRTWTRGSVSMSLNFTDNELTFNSGIIPKSKTPLNTESVYTQAADNYLKNILGSKFSTSLIQQNISYHIQQGNDTLPSNPNDATLIRITYYQALNGYPLTNTSETGAIVSLFLDKNLGLIALKVKDGYESLTSLGQYKTTPLSELISNSKFLALRINASPYYDIAVDTTSAKNIFFNQSTVQIAYYSYNHQMVPVYLLQGTVNTSTTTEQSGLYILPATTR